MLAVVRLALRRPYTFVVMAILIVLFGSLAAVRTPTDIFPDIRIPVIAAVWTYAASPRMRWQGASSITMNGSYLPRSMT